MNLQINGYFYFETGDLESLFPDDFKAFKDELQKIKKASDGYCYAVYNAEADVADAIGKGQTSKFPELQKAVESILTKLRKAGANGIVFTSKGNKWVFAFTYDGLITLNAKGKRLFGKLERNLNTTIDSDDLTADIHLW
jgi:hypothetical protein